MANYPILVGALLSTAVALNSVPASGQEAPGDWAFVQEGDEAACRKEVAAGNKPQDVAACNRVLWTYWLWPRLAEILSDGLKAPPVVVIPRGPDPGPLLDRGNLAMWFKIRDLGRLSLGNPSPQPSVSFMLPDERKTGIPKEMVVEELGRVSDALQGAAKVLENDIETLGGRN